MLKKINEAVSVNLVFDHKKKTSRPKFLIWNNKSYKIEHHGLHHKYKRGDTTYHVFSGSSDALNFRLVLNSDSLHWVLEEVYDTRLR